MINRHLTFYSFLWLLLTSNAFLSANEWSTAKAISDPTALAQSPQIGIDAKKRSIAIWENGTFEGVSSQILLPSAIQTSTFKKKRWNLPTNLSKDADAQLSTFGMGANHNIAVNHKGKAVAIWLAGVGTPEDPFLVQASYYAGGRWSLEPKILESFVGLPGPVTTDVAIDDEGNAVAVWTSFDGMYLQIHAATRIKWKEKWGPVQLVSKCLNNMTPNVAVDGKGNAVAIWAQFSPTSSDIGNILTASLPFNHNKWSDPIKLQTANLNEITLQAPQIDASKNSTAVAVWSNATSNVSSNIEAVTYKFTDGKIKPPSEIVQLSTDNTSANLFPQVKMNAKGKAVAVWEVDGIASTFTSVEAATLHNEVWGPSVYISPTFLNSFFANSFLFLTSPHVGIDHKGNAVVVWAQSAGDELTIQATKYYVDKGWLPFSKIQTLSNSITGIINSAPNVAVSKKGHATAVWTSGSNLAGVIYSSQTKLKQK